MTQRSLASMLEEHIRCQHALPQNFMFFRWECLPHGGPTIYYELEGGVVETAYRSGPRKGRPNYSKAKQRRVFRVTEHEYKQLLVQEPTQ